MGLGGFDLFDQLDHRFEPERREGVSDGEYLLIAGDEGGHSTPQKFLVFMLA